MSGIWSDAAHWLSDEAAIRALAPSGRLRVGIAVGKAQSAVWTLRDARGRPQGVTVEIAKLIAEMTDLPLDLVEYESSGAVIAAASRGEWDVAFAPVDEERKAVVDFAAAYYVGESTCMVAPNVRATSVEDLNRGEIRIIGVEDTATIRSARWVFTQASISGVAGLDEALSLFRAGSADAMALGRESLLSIAASFPDARILDGAFHTAATAAAVPKGAAQAKEFVGAVIEEMKSDGAIRRIFDRCGMKHAAVAPAGLGS
ncbi:MAG TPA: transporter substrate-binding domain-containing protein [Hyphomicrobium zavarzinii]|nr:transporter substrate-binding domain-containing protein [Hyphomicrobium zavarzinii]